MPLGLDLLQHLDDGLVGAAVQRAPQGADAGSGRGVQVRLRRGDHAYGRRRTVLLVVGVEHQHHVERCGDLGRGHVLLVRLGEHHVEEVLGVLEVGARVDEGLVDRRLVRRGGERAYLRDQRRGGHLELLGGVDREVRQVVGLQRVDHRRQDRHRVRGRREAREVATHRLGQSRVLPEQLAEPVALLLGGQLAPDEQLSRLDERAVLGEILDGVAAVAEDALVTVDERDARLARARVAVPVVEGDVPGLRAELADVDGRLVLRAHDHGQFDGRSVGKYELCAVGHVSSSRTPGYTPGGIS